MKPNSMDIKLWRKPYARLQWAAVLICVFMSGMASYPKSEVSEPPTLRIAVGIEPASFDPWQVTTTMQANLIDYVAETLVGADSSGTIVPRLADSWKVSPDGRTLTFSLRKGVRFHDQTRFTAEAVKWNLGRLGQTNLTGYGRMPDPYNLIDSVEAVDSEVVRINLRRPAAARLLSELTTTHTAIISPQSIGKYGNEFANIKHPVGTGPYQFEEYTPRQRLRLKRFDEYWGTRPTFPSLEFLFEPVATNRFYLLDSGNAEVAVLPDLRQIAAQKDSARSHLTLAPSNRTVFFGFNTRRPPFNDARVRRALNYAVDKRTIIARLLPHAADLLDAPMSSRLDGYCRTGMYEYNVRRARRLLREAGVRHGTKMELFSPRGRYSRDFEVAQMVADYLRAVGFDVTVRVIEDWSAYLKTIGNPDVQGLPQIHLFGWAPNFPRALSQLEAFDSGNWPPFGGATTFYKNEKVDSLIKSAVMEDDSRTSNRLSCEAARIIWDDAPWLFLWTQRFPVVQSAELTGLTFLSNEKFFVTYAKWGSQSSNDRAPRK